MQQRKKSRRLNPQSSPGMHPTNSNLIGLQLAVWCNEEFLRLGAWWVCGRAWTEGRAKRVCSEDIISTSFPVVCDSLVSLSRILKPSFAIEDRFSENFQCVWQSLLPVAHRCWGRDSIRTMKEARHGKTWTRGSQGYVVLQLLVEVSKKRGRAVVEVFEGIPTGQRELPRLRVTC